MAQVVSLKSATGNWKSRKKGKQLFLRLAVANFKLLPKDLQQISLCLCVHRKSREVKLLITLSENAETLFSERCNCFSTKQQFCRFPLTNPVLFDDSTPFFIDPRTIFIFKNRADGVSLSSVSGTRGLIAS